MEKIGSCSCPQVVDVWNTQFAGSEQPIYRSLRNLALGVSVKLSRGYEGVRGVDGGRILSLHTSH